MSEFDLIATYFTWNASDKNSVLENISTLKTSQIIKSVGDDAAVLSLAPNLQLVTSMDTLVSGVHFPPNTSPFDIGHKALAVNLSDLAAMGSKPEWFTLALTLPEIDHKWLSEFSQGLKTLADEVGIALVGGDTTSGPLAISIQVMGSVESGKALYRDGAQQGDKIYVTGTLGDGAAGLASIQDKLGLGSIYETGDANDNSHEHAKGRLKNNANDYARHCQQRLNRPTPRLNESNLIKDFSSACIDVSDGLLQDLSHILDQSSLLDSETTLGAVIDLSKVPLSNALQSINNQQALAFALTGGDDYELLFTIPQDVESAFLKATKLSISKPSNPVPREAIFTCIGIITNEKGIIDNNNNLLNAKGFNHFS